MEKVKGKKSAREEKPCPMENCAKRRAAESRERSEKQIAAEDRKRLETGNHGKRSERDKEPCENTDECHVRRQGKRVLEDFGVGSYAAWTLRWEYGKG